MIPECTDIIRLDGVLECSRLNLLPEIPEVLRELFKDGRISGNLAEPVFAFYGAKLRNRHVSSFDILLFHGLSSPRERFQVLDICGFKVFRCRYSY